MEYTVEKIEELASIARVPLDEERARHVRALLEDMRQTASVLRDGRDLPDPFLGAVSLEGLREDCVKVGMDRDTVLSMAPACADGCVTVPRTVEG